MTKQSYYLYKQAADPYHELPIPDTVDYEKVPVGKLYEALVKRVKDTRRRKDLQNSKIPVALSSKYTNI